MKITDGFFMGISPLKTIFLYYMIGMVFSQEMEWDFTNGGKISIMSTSKDF